MQLIDPSTGTILQTTTTDSNGDYSFGNLVAGNYSVTVQSNETIASGGDFNTGTSTAAVTVATGQSVTSVNADLTVPQQYTFQLMDGTRGSINFSIPWNQVDDTQENQSIALTDFSITLGSQTFYEASTTFTTSPSVQFAYGQMEGITFAFDASGSGLPYSTVSMSGSNVLSAFNTLTNMLESTTAAAVPTGGLDFSTVFSLGGPNGKTEYPGKILGTGTPPKGKLVVVINTQNGKPFAVEVDFGDQISASALVDALNLALAGEPVTATISSNGNSIQISGTADNPITSITATLTGGQNFGSIGWTSIGAVNVITSIK